MVKVKDCAKEVIVIVNKISIENKCRYKTEKELKKEIKMIKEYCRQKKYYIDTLKIIDFCSSLWFVETVFKERFDNTYSDVETVVISSFKEIVHSDEQVFAIITMLNEERVMLESIKEGIVGKDIIYKLERKGVENEK